MILLCEESRRNITFTNGTTKIWSDMDIKWPSIIVYMIYYLENLEIFVWWAIWNYNVCLKNKDIVPKNLVSEKVDFLVKELSLHLS